MSDERAQILSFGLVLLSIWNMLYYWDTLNHINSLYSDGQINAICMGLHFVYLKGSKVVSFKIKMTDVFLSLKIVLV